TPRNIACSALPLSVTVSCEGMIAPSITVPVWSLETVEEQVTVFLSGDHVSPAPIPGGVLMHALPTGEFAELGMRVSTWSDCQVIDSPESVDSASPVTSVQFW